MKNQSFWLGALSSAVIILFLLLIGSMTGKVTLNTSNNSETKKSTSLNIEKIKEESNLTIKKGVNVAKKDRNIKGAKDAKITIIEYSSFSCGYCNKVRSTIDKLLEKYPNDIEIDFRQFDRGGTDAVKALAVECAADQGKFWEMHDATFDNPQASTSEISEALKLNKSKFNKCIESKKYADKVKTSTEEARSKGINGTPSFLINGEKVIGAQPIEKFIEIIEKHIN